MCGLSLSAFNALRAVIPTIHVGTRVLFREDDVRDWLRVRAGLPSQKSRRSSRKPRLRQRVPGATFSVRLWHADKERELSTQTADRAEAQAFADRLFARVNAPPSADDPGVYALRAGPHIKIGRSDVSIKQRIGQLQTGQALKLELLGVLSSDPEDENKYHEVFAPFRERGEWFRASPMLLAVIKRIVEFGE